MNTMEKIGLRLDGQPASRTHVCSYLNLKLAALGLPTVYHDENSDMEQLSAALLAHHREAQRLLADYLCPVDQRIQDFLDSYLQGSGIAARLPSRTFVLDRYGLGRELS